MLLFVVTIWEYGGKGFQEFDKDEGGLWSCGVLSHSSFPTATIRFFLFDIHADGGGEGAVCHNSPSYPADVHYLCLESIHIHDF